MNNNIFAITIEDIQHEAQERLGRLLNEDEIVIVKNGLEQGILTSIDIVYNTIFKGITY